MLLLECVSNGSKNKTRDFRASKFTACLKDVLFSPSVCVRLCMCASVHVFACVCVFSSHLLSVAAAFSSGKRRLFWLRREIFHWKVQRCAFLGVAHTRARTAIRRLPACCAVEAAAKEVP